VQFVSWHRKCLKLNVKNLFHVVDRLSFISWECKEKSDNIHVSTSSIWNALIVTLLLSYSLNHCTAMGLGYVRVVFSCTIHPRLLNQRINRRLVCTITPTYLKFTLGFLSSNKHVGLQLFLYMYIGVCDYGIRDSLLCSLYNSEILHLNCKVMQGNWCYIIQCSILNS